MQIFLIAGITALFSLLCVAQAADSHVRGAISSDPRTIELKSTVGTDPDSNSSSNSSSNSNSNSNISQGNNNDFSNLRFVVFGTSRSYGSRLPEEDRVKMAYPFLLSPHVANLAVPASNSVYTEKCAYSMIGEKDIYDVIILEYMAGPFDSTLLLAKRLRQRFPNAYIMVLDVWSPSAYLHRPSGKSMFHWLKNEGFNHIYADDPMLAQTVKEKTNAKDWLYLGPYSPKQLETLQQNGFAHVSPPKHRDAHEAIENHRWFMDTIHFSVMGHQMVKQLIFDELHRANFRLQQNNVVNPWTTFDQCEVWFGTGETVLPHSIGFVMNQFDFDKYALEARDEISWIKVKNTSQQINELYLSYMVTAPGCLYNTVQISISSSSANTPPTWIQCDDDKEYNFPVHVVKRVYLGQVPPGETTISLKTSANQKKWPFRIVGTIMTERDENGMVLFKRN